MRWTCTQWERSSSGLPAAAAGEWGSYASTGTYTRVSMRQMIVLVNYMRRLDPESASRVDSALASTVREFGPIAEKQIVLLALTALPQ